MLVVINHGVDLRELPAVYMVEATPSNTTTMMLQERWKIHDWKMMDKIAELEKNKQQDRAKSRYDVQLFTRSCRFSSFALCTVMCSMLPVRA